MLIVTVMVCLLIHETQKKVPTELYHVDSLLEKPRPPLLYHGLRINYKHAQLRMKYSKLNYYLYSLHVLDSPTCPCGHDREDSSHLHWNCPFYFQCYNNV